MNLDDPIAMDAAAYEYIRNVLRETMTDPDSWDGEDSESYILGQYIYWLAAGQPVDGDGYPVREHTLFDPAPRVDALGQLRALRIVAHELAELAGACDPPDIANGYDQCPCGRGSTWPCQMTRAVWKVRGIEPAAEIAAVMERVRFEIWHAGGPYPEDVTEETAGAWIWPDSAPGDDTEMQEEFIPPAADFPTACALVHEHDPIACAPQSPAEMRAEFVQDDDVTP